VLFFSSAKVEKELTQLKDCEHKEEGEEVVVVLAKNLLCEEGREERAAR